MNVQLIIFDCDGVLVDSEHISSRVMSEIFVELGLNLSPDEVFENLRGGSMKNTIQFVKDHLGEDFDFDLEAAYRQRSFDAYQNEMTAIEGVESLLKQLKIRACVGSNGPQHKIKLNLDITGLRQYFNDENIFSAYDIQVWKPKPDLYLGIADRFNIPPQNCVVVEDSLSGAKAAQAAGIRCYGYTRDTPAKDFQEIGAIPIDHMSRIIEFHPDIFTQKKKTKDHFNIF